MSGCCEQPGLMPVETALERLLELAAQTPIDTCEQVPACSGFGACPAKIFWLTGSGSPFQSARRKA